MDPQSIEALSAEGGNQGGMDIQNRFSKCADKLRGQNSQKARQYRHINPVLGQQLLYLGLEARLPAHGNRTGHPRRLGAGNGPDAGPVGNDQTDLAAFQLSAGLGVQQGLEVGAAAGDQHGDGRLQHSVTFSPLWTISPII